MPDELSGYYDEEAARAADIEIRTARPSPRPRAVPDGLLPAARLVKAAPSLAKVAAVSWWHLASWSVGAGVAGANYIAKRALNGETATSIVGEAATDLRAAAWRALGVPAGYAPTGAAVKPPALATTSDLQKQGIELMRRSNDVNVVEDTHPAFARILTEITPDEARILRFLYLEGDQPALDIRTRGAFGIGSELVVSGLSMLAEHAGCRYPDRLDQYVVNLSRLGLVEFSRESVSNPTRYQVLEAQPTVVAALRQAGRFPKMVQRSVHVTSFGAEFCRTCLPLTPPTKPRPTAPGAIPGPRPS